MKSSIAINKNFTITVGVFIAVMGIVLVISGALGVTMYNTMDEPKGDTPQELADRQRTANGINASFIIWIIIGVAFLAAYCSFISYEAGINKTRKALCTSDSNPLCVGPIDSAHKWGIATAVLVYVANILLITTCAEGISLHKLIKKYKGGDPKEVDDNKRTSDGINSTFIVFLVFAVIVLVMYTAWLGNLHQTAGPMWKSFQSSVKGIRASGNISTPTSLQGGASMFAFTNY